MARSLLSSSLSPWKRLPKFPSTIPSNIHIFELILNSFCRNIVHLKVMWEWWTRITERSMLKQEKRKERLGKSHTLSNQLLAQTKTLFKEPEPSQCSHQNTEWKVVTYRNNVNLFVFSSENKKENFFEIID